MIEIWKDIPGYEGYYQVSNLGRYKSLDRDVVCRDGRLKHIKGKIRKTHKYTNGYLSICVCLNGIKKQLIAHRVVAQVFLPTEDKSLEINHKDENKENNVTSNLEWVTHRYNANYGTKVERTRGKLTGKLVGNKNHMFGRTGSKSPVYGWHGKDHPSSLPVRRIDPNNNYYKDFESITDAANELGVSVTAVNNVLKNRAKTCLGYRFKYLTKNKLLTD